MKGNYLLPACPAIMHISTKGPTVTFKQIVTTHVHNSKVPIPYGDNCKPIFAKHAPSHSGLSLSRSVPVGHSRHFQKTKNKNTKHFFIFLFFLFFKSIFWVSFRGFMKFCMFFFEHLGYKSYKSSPIVNNWAKKQILGLQMM